MHAAPIAKDLVLVGGGHSHVEVLRRFGMRPVPGVRLTLVTKDVQTPYSGMLPGFVSGCYTFDECHIDLVRLARYANARLLHAEAAGVDTLAQEVQLRGRPPIAYDVLSLNVGITPVLSHVPGAVEHAIPVKPIDVFRDKLDALLERARRCDGEFRVAVVGAGPGGVELACALQHRLGVERQEGTMAAQGKVILISRGRILSELSPYARSAFLPLLHQRGIELHEATGGVARVDAAQLTLQDGTLVPCDACLWCTQAGAASWLASSGLPTDAAGFLAVNGFLQSDGGPPNVFGAGDTVSMTQHPRPKAGVYAVRAGAPLADNLRSYLQQRSLTPWVPQSTHLNLISAGDKYAVAVKGRLGIQGGYLWTWKDWIDRKFMDKYGSDLNLQGSMGGAVVSDGQDGLGAEALALASAAKMRCAGCGSKVAASTLTRVLQRLQQDMQQQEAAAGRDLKGPSPGRDAESLAVLVGLDAADDAAVLAAPPPGHVTIHTVDFFRAPVDDPFTFGAISANHALSDCYAMGAAPQAALAIAVLPFASPAKVEADLYQLLAGASQVLTQAGCRLVGGHTCEGPELALGFSVYGTARPEELMRRSGLVPGQALVLTKAVGTGTVLAAAMRGMAKGRWVAAAVAGMLQGNGPAAEVLRQHGATACTDVTGFGLLGHLAEMAAASGAATEVDVAAVPLLPGAQACVEAGVLSSLHEDNAKVAAVVANAEEAAAHPVWPLLLDPQTSGGLLAGVPSEAAAQCVEALHAAGYSEAAVVGQVGSSGKGGVSLKL